MDRPVSTSAALAAALEDTSPPGWDAHAVWLERVRNPHLGSKLAAVAPRIVLADQSVGGDPLETWRLRVRRPRKQAT